MQDAYMSNTTQLTMEHTMTQINEHRDKNPTPAPGADDSDREQLEVRSRWFSVRLDAINGYTLAAMAMILTAMIIIVALLVPQ